MRCKPNSSFGANKHCFCLCCTHEIGTRLLKAAKTINHRQSGQFSQKCLIPECRKYFSRWLLKRVLSKLSKLQRKVIEFFSHLNAFIKLYSMLRKVEAFLQSEDICVLRVNGMMPLTVNIFECVRNAMRYGTADYVNKSFTFAAKETNGFSNNGSNWCL